MQMFDSTVVRAHVWAAGGGQNDQALGRSRGGFSTKIHLKVDLGGLPLAFHLTGGEASDCRNFEILLNLGPDIAPRAVVTDKGYDSKVNRDAARRRGICPVIPYKSNAIERPTFFPKRQGTRANRADGRQAQALQAHCTTLRENRKKLRLIFAALLICKVDSPGGRSHRTRCPHRF